jgi:hypothetical protein
VVPRQQHTQQLLQHSSRQVRQQARQVSTRLVRVSKQAASCKLRCCGRRVRHIWVGEAVECEPGALAQQQPHQQALRWGRQRLGQQQQQQQQQQ